MFGWFIENAERWQLFYSPLPLILLLSFNKCCIHSVCLTIDIVLTNWWVDLALSPWAFFSWQTDTEWVTTIERESKVTDSPIQNEDCTDVCTKMVCMQMWQWTVVIQVESGSKAVCPNEGFRQSLAVQLREGNKSPTTKAKPSCSQPWFWKYTVVHILILGTWPTLKVRATESGCLIV